MLGPKINTIEAMIKIGKLKLPQLQVPHQQQNQQLWLNGPQFSMNPLKVHHQIIPRNLS